MGRTRHIGVAVGAIALIAASCSGSGGGSDASATSSNAAEAHATTGDGPGLVEKPDESDQLAGSQETVSTNHVQDTAASSETAVTAAPTTTVVLPTVPETGVPGIDSADLFCRSWSEFAGTFQALALASTFANDDLSAARSELVASGVIIAAVAGLGEHLPAELESERTELIDGLVGPMERRAIRNYSGLEAAELSAEQIDELAELWLEALVSAGVDEPNIQLDVPEDLAVRVDGVASALQTSVPPIREDPSLVTNASTPLTDAYILENCPDQGTLGGNDVIDQ